MFELSPHIDKNKIFLVNLSEIEKRLDPFYYIPYISNLEKEVRKHNPKPLRYYVKYIAGGATPKTSEKEKYYSNKENGIPFLRVQNLSPTGYLQLDDVKYINKETHNGYLKRSQVSEGDLLVKITGVGRMAVASVAPEGFVGNTNQHMVVIKTKSKETSLILASYLNTDIGEKLASRRATGGTRPALDYSALLSIPIIFDEKILEITKQAINKKQQKEAEAKRLLNSLDDYLLGELGITLPEKDNSLENRMFKVNFSEVTGGRFDPYYYQSHFRLFFEKLNRSTYPIYSIKELSKIITSGITPLSGGKAYTIDKENGIPFIRSGNIDINGNINFDDLLYLKEEIHKTLMRSSQVKYNDLLVAIVGATIGQVGIYKDEREANINQAIALIRLKDGNNVDFIKEVLKSSIGQYNLNRLKRPVARANINLEEISTIQIPIPPIEKQNEIAEHIKEIRERAKQLKAEAKEVLEQARQEVEKMILGEENA